ncbi:MAG TPA: methyltransferase domain-containing protein [Thermoplasmata archaeon]|nr:methyltransferase domain-containing protein [Thermoplasmata archaeon]
MDKGSVTLVPWKYTEEYYREYTRTTWNESAEAYVRFMALLAPFRSALVEALASQPGERVLDLGTGPGEPALTIARRVGPTGDVLGIDLSEKMVALAGRNAREREIRNVEFRTMDCAKLELKDGSFDAVVSNFGFQIFTDPEAAAREAHRVLAPHGRIAVTVWPSGDRVPFLHAIVGPMLSHAEPDETGYIPTPYETGGPGEMIAFLSSAGFRDGEERRVSTTVHLPDADAYLDTVLKGTPLGHSLSEETAEVQREVLRDTRERLAQYTTGDGVTLPAECVLVTARF